MAIMTPSPPQSETVRRPDAPEMLFPEARRRRRRRWMIGTAVVALCAGGAGGGIAAEGSGSGGATGRGAMPGVADSSPATVAAAAGSAVDLAGGRWSTMVPPQPGVVKTWDLATWTGKYVIAWGSTGTATAPGGQTAGSSEHGAEFDPATHSWRSLPAAPVDVTIESTAWTGHQILVWGSASASVRRSGRNELLAFDPMTWRWKRLAAPPIPPRTDAEVLWGGTKLIVIGGHAGSIAALLSGATYDPRANRWSALPTVPRIVVGARSKEEPVGVTAAWSAGALYVWITDQITRACGVNCGEISAKVQALRWRPGTSRWHPAATPPESVPVYNASAPSMGQFIALLDGSSCLPEMSCPASMSGASSLFNVKADTWSSIPASSVLNRAASFAWTGRSLIAVSPYLTSAGYLVGGYAAAFDPASGWVDLPELPVPTAPPSGPVLSGTVWAGSELIDSGLVLLPGHRSSTTGPSTASAVPTCPAIAFPDLVGGAFCGPPPGPGDGSGPDGSCLGTETAPPCGPGMVAGRYYAYTLISTCTNDYVDGRWWKNGLPGGMGPLYVWMSVNTPGTGASWIGPNGAVGLRPSVATSCT
ncbi:MAG: Kelch repeat-containing protein [Acidimicrobiales bacterium]